MYDVSVTYSVSHATSQWTKRVERCINSNLLLIFTKLANKVVSQEMLLSIVLVEIGNSHIHQNVSVVNFLALLHWKTSLTSNISKNGDRLNGDRTGNNSWAFDRFHDVWPWMTWTVIDPSYRNFTSNASVVKKLQPVCPKLDGDNRIKQRISCYVFIHRESRKTNDIFRL